MIINPVKCVKGELTVPGDKSISHRAIMCGALSDGHTHIDNFLSGADCLSTIECFKSLGVDIRQNSSSVDIFGRGHHGLKKPDNILDAGNSGTTIRLMSGILSAQPFTCSIQGDSSLAKRPMSRVILPLSAMNAIIESNNGYTPLTFHSSKLTSTCYSSPIASAQVKSSILFAGLYASGETVVYEPYLSRNHTEIMFRQFGVDVTTKQHSDFVSASVRQCHSLKACDIYVPGDISSAAYFMAAGLILPNSIITIKHVGINPTRNGIIDVIRAMGGNIKVEQINSSSDGEPLADITVSSSELHGINIKGSLIPRLIDEIPIIAVLAAYANGKTIISDAAELKVKESNRIDLTVRNLNSMGVISTAVDDGMIIEGGCNIHGANIQTCEDHRIAMSFAIAGLGASGITVLDNSTCVDISYPGFFDVLETIVE